MQRFLVRFRLAVDRTFLGLSLVARCVGVVCVSAAIPAVGLHLQVGRDGQVGVGVLGDSTVLISRSSTFKRFLAFAFAASRAFRCARSSGIGVSLPIAVATRSQLSALHSCEGIFFLELFGVLVTAIFVMRAITECLSRSWCSCFDLWKIIVARAAGTRRFVYFKTCRWISWLLKLSLIVRVRLTIK